ncbi:hypothetical protein AL755_16315 [Arthrobacter sp. ERGS1:01]|nr:hypothetical protein AL755_16315 [Arthrobacter sp. ERGS1:01]
MLRKALRLVGLFVIGAIALQAVFFGLLIVGQLVPDKPIVDALAIAVNNKTYGPAGIPDRMGGTADTFTECVVVGTGLGSVDMNPVQRAAFMPRIANCESGSGQILTLAEGKDLPPDQVAGYYKYWAGYTILTRPVLAFFGLGSLRIVSGALLLGTAIGAVWMLGSRTRKLAAAALLLPLALASNLMSTPSTSFSQALSISAIFAGIIICSWAASKSLAWALAGVGVSAGLFCYVDLLTTPAIPWVFSTAVVAAVTFTKTLKVKETAIAGIAAAVMWPVAFGFTWVSRWVIAALFLGVRTTVDFITSNVEFRTGGSHTGVTLGFGNPTNANWAYWTSHMPTATFVLVVCLIVVVLAIVVAWLRAGWRRALTGLMLSASGIFVFVWYEAVSNHSQIHAFFTYRGIPAALGILVFSFLLVAGLPRKLPRATVENAVPSGSGEASAAPVAQTTEDPRAESSLEMAT